jgi:hypothetical protein
MKAKSLSKLEALQRQEKKKEFKNSRRNRDSQFWSENADIFKRGKASKIKKSYSVKNK